MAWLKAGVVGPRGPAKRLQGKVGIMDLDSIAVTAGAQVTLLLTLRPHPRNEGR